MNSTRGSRSTSLESSLRETVDVFREFADRIARVGMSRHPVWLAMNELTQGQIRALVYLEEHRTSTIGGIAEWLGVGEPTASQLVDRLVRSGYAERSEDPSDRRRTIVRPSAAGRAVVEDRIQVRDERIRTITERISAADRKALLRGLRAASAVMDELIRELANPERDTAARDPVAPASEGR